MNLNFVCPIWEYHIPLDQRLIDFVYEHRNEQKNWSSNYLGASRHLYLMQFECFQQFVVNIKSTIRKKLFLLKPYREYDLNLTALWCNLNYAADVDYAHIHYPDIAGVYYLQTPKNCGDLMMHNPHKDTSQGKFARLFKEFKTSYTVTPEVGKGLIFPCWVPHQVLQNQSGEDRISMSFGFELIEKESIVPFKHL
jgi:uncharacterized protein (TIGR02466 family)